MTRHRVLHFLSSGGIGGAERAVYQIVREEIKRGEWGVGVAFARASGPYYEAITSLGCEVVDFGMAAGWDIRPSLRNVEALRSFDLHHFHVLEPSLMMASARCSGAIRVFTQRHGAPAEVIDVRKRIRRAVGGILLREYFHAIAGNTRHAAHWASAAYHLEHLPCIITPNGLDFSLLVPTQAVAEIRRLLNTGAESIVVGTSGTFKECKRFDRMIRLAAATPVADIVLVGDGKLRTSLESRARALGAQERVHITGLIENVADYLQAMDVFVLPSSAEESFGNSVVEAMAIGIPSVVFSDSPGLCEHIEDGETGYIVENEAALARLVQRLATDPEERARVGLAGAKRVRSRYTLERMHESYRRLYETAVSSRKSA